MPTDDSRFRDVPYGLILRLYPGKRGWEVWKPSPDHERIEAMAAIESQRLIGSLPYLAPLSTSASAQVREAAGRTIARLFEVDFTASLALLAPGLGRLVHYETPAADAVRGITREHVRNLSDSAEYAWASLGLLSFHGNGWVREAALDRLGLLKNGREIPFLLYRSNDWVEPVARKAMALLEERLARSPIRQLSDHLPTVYRLRARQRGYLSDFQAKLLERISRDEEIRFLTETADRAKPLGLRRWILSIATDAADSRSDAASLATELRRDPDPIVRANAWARIWKDGKTSAVLSEGFEDAWAPIRRRSLEVLCDCDAALHYAALHRALFDSASMVRATARYFLAKIPGCDPGQIYRNRLSSGEPPCVATMFGIAESGCTEDAELLRPFLAADRASLRKSAVSAIGALNAPAFRNEIRAALHDSAPGVTKAARLVLAKHGRLLTGQFLLDALNEEHPLHVRGAAIRLISALYKWDRIVTLLDAFTYAPEFNDVIRDEIRRWLQMYNRSLLQPSREQIEAMHRLIASHGSLLPASLARELMQIANSFPASDT